MWAPVTRRDQAIAAFADLSFVAFLGLPMREVSTPGSCTVWRGNTNDLLLDRPPDSGPVMSTSMPARSPSTAPRVRSRSPIAAVSTARPLGASGYREPGGGPTQSPGRAFLEPGSFTVSSSGGGPVSRRQTDRGL